MRIVLSPVPGAQVPGIPVGRINPGPASALKGGIPMSGAVLSYDGRQAYIDERVVDHDEIAEPLWEAVDAAARRLFGPHEWSSNLSAVTGMNARSMMRGRILSHGLPAPILSLLGRAATSRSPRALGHLMLAVAWSWDEAVKEGERRGGPDDPLVTSGKLNADGRRILQERLDELLATATAIVEGMQGDSAGARARRETGS